EAGSRRLGDADTGAPRAAPPAIRGRIANMVFSPDGATLAVSYLHRDGEVALSDVATGKLVRSLNLDRTTEHSRGLAFGPLGLAAVAQSEVHVWYGATFKERPRLDMPPSAMAALAFSPDGKVLAVARRLGGGGRAGRLFAAEDGRPLADLDMGSDLVAIAFSPDGKRLAGAAASGEARIWEPQNGEWKQIAAVRHELRINALAFNPSGSLLATASEDHT